MNFDLNALGERQAKFHLTVDILANLFSTQELILELYCQQNNITKGEAKAKLEQLTAKNRQMIHDIIDAEFGNVKMEDITKK